MAPRLSSRAGRAVRTARTVLRRLRSKLARQSSSASSRKPVAGVVRPPTLLTRMSRPPKVSTARPTRRAGPSGVARSTSMVCGVTSRRAALSLRVPPITCAPSAVSARVTARPMPRPAPVTTARLPCSFRSMTAPRGDGRCGSSRRSIVATDSRPGLERERVQRMYETGRGGYDPLSGRGGEARHRTVTGTAVPGGDAGRIGAARTGRVDAVVGQAAGPSVQAMVSRLAPESSVMS